MACSTLARVFVLLWALLLLAQPTYALETPATDRAALVIGVDDYQHLKDLPNPVLDAKAVADLLSGLGFAVTYVKNPTYDELTQKIADFGASTSNANLILTYFAGHGMAAIHNDVSTNVMVPVDGIVTCEDRQAQRVLSIDRLMQATAHVPNKVFIFDACRNDPFETCSAGAKRSAGYGFRDVGATQVGVGENASAADRSVDRYGSKEEPIAKTMALLAFSTDSGELAADGPPGSHSPYAREILNATSSDLRLPVREFLDRISERVTKATSDDQYPWVLTLGGEPQQCLDGQNCALRARLNAEISRRTSTMLSSRAEELLERNYPRKALALALEGLPDLFAAGEAQIEPSIETALRKAVAAAPRYSSFDQLTGRPLAITADRQRIAVHGSDGNLSVMRIADQALVRLEAPQPYTIGDGESWVRFSEDGSLVVRSSSAYGVDVFNVESGTLVAEPVDEQSGVVEINRDGSLIAGVATDLASGSDFTPMAWVFHRPTGRLTRLDLPLGARPEFVAFNPAGDELALLASLTDSVRGIYRYTVTRYDVGETVVRENTFTVLEPPPYNSERADNVTGIRYLDATALLTWDNAAHLWDVSSGEQIRTFVGHESSYLGVVSAQFSDDGKILATGGEDRNVFLWSVEDGRRIRRFALDEVPWDLAFDRDGRIFAVRDNQDRTFVWDLSDRSDMPLRTLRNEVAAIGEDTFWKPGVFAFDESGERVLTWAGGFVALDANRHDDRFTYRAGRNGRTGNFAASGSAVALLVGDDLEVRDLTTGVPTCKMSKGGVGYLRGATSFVDSSGSKALTIQPGTPGWTQTTGEAGRVNIIDLKRCQVEAQLVKDGYAINLAAFSPSGNFVAAFAFAPTATSSKDAFRLLVWDTRSRKVVSEFWGHTSWIVGIGFSPDETMLLTTARGETTKIWDIATGSEIFEVESPSGSLNNKAFSPDGRSFLTTSQTLRIWNAANGTLEHEHVGLSGANAEFSPNGELIALASRPVRVVDARTGSIKAEFDIDFQPETVTISPEGTSVLIVGFDGTVLVMPLNYSVPAIAELACSLGPQQLSLKERVALHLDGAPSSTMCDTIGARRQ